MPPLKDKTVLVTGAARRVGRGIVLQLAQQGCHIVIHYKSSEREAVNLAEEVRSMGRRARVLPADLSSKAECEKLVSDASGKAGKLDFLVNSASVFPSGDILSADGNELDRTVVVNSWSPLWLSNAFYSAVEAGAIVNLLDTRVTGYDFSNFPYYISKRILSDITENLALRFAPKVRVNAVAPGLILPPEGKGASYLQRVSRIVPMKTNGTVSDVAEAVSFLLSSDFVTGQTIFVDGGQHLLHHIFGDNR